MTSRTATTPQSAALAEFAPAVNARDAIVTHTAP
jgi:hypothetical protein